MPMKKVVQRKCIRPNWRERDGTRDNSPFTSCQTDGRRQTSPGVASPFDQEIISLSPRKEYEVYPRAFQIQCVEATCLYTKTAAYFNPVIQQTQNVLQCFNCQTDCTCEWEYANNNEIDNSNDNGIWTSFDTNNQNGNTDVQEAVDSSVETSVASDITEEGVHVRSIHWGNLSNCGLRYNVNVSDEFNCFDQESLRWTECYMATPNVYKCCKYGALDGCLGSDMKTYWW